MCNIYDVYRENLAQRVFFLFKLKNMYMTDCLIIGIKANHSIYGLCLTQMFWLAFFQSTFKTFSLSGYTTNEKICRKELFRRSSL